MWPRIIRYDRFVEFTSLNENTQNKVTYIPKTKAEFNKLRHLRKDQLVALGMQIWDNKNEKSLFLLPVEWYDNIPQGFTLYTINDERIKFDRAQHHKDNRFGVLPYGMLM